MKLKAVGNLFTIEKGVRQGNPLYPKQFNAVLESISKKLDWDNYGLNINSRHLSHLRFADDIILIEEEPQKLQQMIQSLAMKSREISLDINSSKTKLITNSSMVHIGTDGINFEHVQEYTPRIYLGQIIASIINK